MVRVVAAIVFGVAGAVCNAQDTTGRTHAARSNREAPEPPPRLPRIGISGGMGVSYVNAQDIVDRVNGSGVLYERVPDFKAAAKFFCACTVPLSADWLLKFEYAYLVGSYTPGSSFGPTEFFFNSHMPTIIGQYVLFEEDVYNVRIGAGAGYHFGSYSEKWFNVNGRFTASGIGALIDFEANTAFGENLFGYLGGDINWEFIGDLRDGNGQPPAGGLSGPEASLNFFSIGARLGFTYYF